ncbi:uncharacterized protein LOC132281486 [Cornus florida]|uniref:uncharacterized protein LOC132281486 n=1 Tax=Cornus florida TaxID=4283 RepID=UPI00289F0739|nr:uncharacterized protein LOC132281486 [Cornus florida]
MDLLQNFRVPNFATFSGEGNQLTLEHIGRFTLKCGPLSNNDWYKMKLFSNTLTETAFKWYLNLPPNSIHTWQQMQNVFHDQFYRTEPEVSMSDLSRIHQLSNEDVETFLARFKKARNRCQLTLPEEEFVNLALRGLDFELRKKFEGTHCGDLFQLADRVTKYEKILREENERKNSSQGTYYKDPNYEIHMVDTVYDDLEVDAVEIISKKPYVCKALAKPLETVSGVQPSSSSAKRNIFEAGKQYAFDISKAEQIFDHLLSDKIIKVTGVHKIPSADEIKGREYCKYHNSWNHATNNCVVFRNVIQVQIEKGAWKFPEKKKR